MTPWPRGCTGMNNKTAHDAPGRTNGAGGWKPCRSKDRATDQEQTAGTGVEWGFATDRNHDRVESRG